MPDTSGSNGSNSNGQIMVAQSDIEHLNEKLSEFIVEVRGWMRDANERNVANSISISSITTALSAMDKRVGDLEKKSERWDLLNSVGIAVMAVIQFLVTRAIP